MLKWILLLAIAVSGMMQRTTAQEWIVVQPDDARGRVNMPAQPTASERTIEPVAGKPITVKLQIATVDKKFTYMFGYHDQTPATNMVEIKNILDGGVKGAIARTLGALEKVEEIKVDGLLGRQFQYTCIQGENKLKVASRLLLEGGRLYQLNYISPQDAFNAADAKKFLESFERVKPVNK